MIIIILNCETHSFVYYDENHVLQGYESIYLNKIEWVIGPCYCNSKEIGKAIIESLINKIHDVTVKELDGKKPKLVIFVPDSSQNSLDFINETNDICHLKKGDTCPVRYKNGYPKNQNWQNCFAIVSELAKR